MPLLALALAADVALAIVGATTEINLAREIANLDTPVLLVLFIGALYRRKIVWGWQFDLKADEALEWKTAALGRTQEREQAATIAEAAIAAGRKARRA